MKKITLTASLTLACFLSATFLFSQMRTPLEPDTDREQLLKLSEYFHQRHQKRKAEVEKLAFENGWSVKTVSDDKESQIIFIDEQGMPQSYITYNSNAAQTTGTNQLWTGGSLGLNLSGNGYLIGIWDGGGVRTTHQEFGTRVTIMDGASLRNHATHVGGTMIASGVQTAAQGMAQQATLRSYDWDDDYAEMASQAASGLTLSNHSYGWNRGWDEFEGNMFWWGTTSISTTEDYLFGFYDETARDLDNIAVNAPNYLIVWAAANDRNDTWSGGHYVRNSSGTWVWSTATRDPDGGADGYDCIPQQGVAKNILTVGAVDDIPGGWTSASNVVMSAFSSWGPTDDGRIKPDIVANGVDLYSTSNASNTSYTWMSGTSMASPNTTGTLALLQEHYRNGRGGTMSAAALKGLVINTANEAGPNEGPDYMFGWGLLNAVGAAQLISDDASQGGLIVQGLLVNGQTKDYTYYSDGSPISVTLCWTDPAGTPPAASLNPTTLMLVNNLNLRVIGTSTHLPWRLNPASPAAAATRGDNTRDNVEKVTVNSPTPGFYTIRVSHGGTLSGGQQAYALIINGLKTLPNRTYCNARSTIFHLYEHITRVQYGSIDNRSQRSPGGYSNYTGLLTTVNIGSSQTITATISGAGSSTWGRVYVDWNQDGDFNDAGETYTLGSGVGPTYSTTISVPSGAYGGYTTMRVRIGWGGTPSPCGIFSYGETEDYTIKVSGTAGLWTGIYDNDWYNMYNWDDANVPTASTNVVIGTPVNFHPTVGQGTASCNQLTINAGGVLSISGGNNIFNAILNVYGDLNSDAGQLTMSGIYTRLQFRGSTNTSWDDDNENDTYTNIRVLKDDPTATLSMWQNMTCSGTFYIQEGIFQINSGWKLTIQSTSTNALRVEDGGTLRLAINRTIEVNGRLYFMDGSVSDFSGGTIMVKGNVRIDFNTANNIAFTSATLVMNGTGNQFIEDADGGTLQLHHLTIDKPSGIVFINGAPLNINGNLLISNGVLSCNNGPSPTTSYNINIKGNWTNNNFPAGFVPGTARVRFNGVGHQYIYSNETFHILEAAMGAALRINNAAYTVTCNQYDWTTGGIDILAGTFTALDLFDNGLFGGFWVNPGATINLYQDISQWVDLNGSLTLNNGGNINVYGGQPYSESWWPNSANASITMNGGILDIKDQTIRIRNAAASFTQNISGGTIRTSQALLITRSDFTPTGGHFELYGSGDWNLFVAAGSHLRNVIINKNAKGQASHTPEGPVYSKRDGLLLGDGSRANNINLSSNINILNNLTISAGSLTLNGKELSIGNYCNVHGTLNMTNAADILTVGQDSWFWLWFYSGSVGNLLEGTVNLHGWIVPDLGSTFNTTTSNTIRFFGNSGGGLSCYEPTATFGNILFQKNTGQSAFIDYLAQPIEVMGTFTISAGNKLYLQQKTLTVHGTFTDQATSEIHMGYLSKGMSEGFSVSGKEPVSSSTRGGSLTINSDYYINGLLDLANGNALLTQGFGINSTGTLKINGGNFINNRPNIDDWTNIFGQLQLSSGLFELTYNSPHFRLGSTSVISGGTIRIGGAFAATSPNVFVPSGGVVEITGVNLHTNIYCYNANHFHNLLINRAGEYSAFMFGYPVQINNDFIVNQGEIRTRSSMVSVSGNVHINNGGILDVGLELVGGGGLAMANGRSITVNNGGILRLNGKSDNQTSVTRIASGHYALNVESGGTIGAEHTIFEYMNTEGVNIKPGAWVDPLKSFISCTFRNGQSGGRLLTINNDQTFAVNYAIFPNNTLGGHFNVFKSLNQGVVTFGGHSGPFTGSAFESDPFSRIHWEGQVASLVDVQGANVFPGQEICFDATNTLTLAGSGSFFIAQNGSFVNLIAGQKITMLEGTHLIEGSYVWARISNTYCTLPPAIIASEPPLPESVVSSIGDEKTEKTSLSWRVYPNPTNGRVFVEFGKAINSSIIEILTMQGARMMFKQTNDGLMKHEFDLSAWPAGIYFVRVFDGETTHTYKLIRQ